MQGPLAICCWKGGRRGGWNTKHGPRSIWSRSRCLEHSRQRVLDFTTHTSLLANARLKDNRGRLHRIVLTSFLLCTVPTLEPHHRQKTPDTPHHASHGVGEEDDRTGGNNWASCPHAAGPPALAFRQQWRRGHGRRRRQHHVQRWTSDVRPGRLLWGGWGAGKQGADGTSPGSRGACGGHQVPAHPHGGSGRAAGGVTGRYRAPQADFHQVGHQEEGVGEGNDGAFEAVGAKGAARVGHERERTRPSQGGPSPVQFLLGWDSSQEEYYTNEAAALLLSRCYHF